MATFTSIPRLLGIAAIVAVGLICLRVMIATCGGHTNSSLAYAPVLFDVIDSPLPFLTLTMSAFTSVFESTGGYDPFGGLICLLLATAMTLVCYFALSIALITGIEVMIKAARRRTR